MLKIHGFPGLWSFVLVDTDKVRSVVCIFGLGCESISCMGMRVRDIRRKMREKCQCVQNAILQGCNWWSQRANIPDTAGIFTQGCFQIKVPYSKFPLMGSRLNYTSKPLEWHMFGPLAPTPEGLPVGIREIFYSPWCSVITRSWLSLLCNSWWPGGCRECWGSLQQQVAFSSARVSPLIF